MPQREHSSHVWTDGLGANSLREGGGKGVEAMDCIKSVTKREVRRGKFHLVLSTVLKLQIVVS